MCSAEASGFNIPLLEVSVVYTSSNSTAKDLCFKPNMGWRNVCKVFPGTPSDESHLGP